MLTILLIIFVTTVVHVSVEQSNPITFASCDVEKSCFLVPTGCDSISTCDFVATYAPDTANPQYIQFELGGKLISPTSNQYIALGFSKDDKMGEDAVTYCSVIAAGDQPSVNLAFNPAKYNQFVATPPEVVMSTSGGMTNNFLWCKFKQQKIPSDSMQNQIFSLDGQPYYLLLARGPAQDAKTIGIHNNRMASGSTVLLSNLTVVKAKKRALTPDVRKALLLAHGITMVLGWWLFVTIAVMFARYFKKTWADTEPCGIKVWFHAHRGLNIIGLLLVIAGFICIFVRAMGEWVGDEHPNHASCGIASVILGLIQPIMAVFRPGPNGKYRPVFNWIHRLVGISAWILANATIWFATDFVHTLTPTPRYGYTGSHYGTAPRTVMIIFWGVTGLTLIALEVHISLTERMVKEEPAIVQANPMAPGGGFYIQQGKGPNLKKIAMTSLSRAAILVFYAVIALVLAVALCCFIGGV